MPNEKLTCPSCGLEFPNVPGLAVRCPCGTMVSGNVPRAKRRAQPQGGPGTELVDLLSNAMGAKPKKGCSCKARATAMDRWGVAGCREHRAEIIGWLEEEKSGFGVAGLLTAGIKAAWNGLPLTVGGLVDEAIRRAEEKQPKPQPRPVDAARQWGWTARGLLGAVQLVEDLAASGAECSQVALLRQARDRLDKVLTAAPSR